MGLWQSRMSKFASYEKSLDRVQEQLQRSLAKRGNRQRRTASLGFWFAVTITIAVTIAAWQVYQVQQLPPKALSYQEHFQRVASAVALPCALGLLYWVALAAVGFMDGFDRRRVKHLEDTKRAMIKELKDMSNFEKTRAIIEKYDPDYAAAQMQYGPPGVIMMQSGGRGRGNPNGTPQRQSAPGMLVPYQQQQGNPLLRTPGHVAGAAATAVAGAGKALMPLLDSLASSLISDNPVLLEDLRRAQQQLQNAEAQAEAAAQESSSLRAQNAALRRKLAELGYEEEDEQGRQELQGLLLGPETSEATAATDTAAQGNAGGSGEAHPAGMLAFNGEEHAAAAATGTASKQADVDRNSGTGSRRQGQGAEGGGGRAEEAGASARESGVGDAVDGDGRQCGRVRQRLHAAGGRISMEH